MKKVIGIIVILIVLYLVYVFVVGKDAMEDRVLPEEIVQPEVAEETKEAVEKEVFNDEFEQKGTLFDVTEGNDVRGINTGCTASGKAMARVVDGVYELRATFDNLPDPQGDDFYEGWIVRTGDNMDVVSTGSLARINGQWVNVYESDTDLRDHLFYVLTIEPNDGDPAPADHILEGVMQ